MSTTLRVAPLINEGVEVFREQPVFEHTSREELLLHFEKLDHKQENKRNIELKVLGFQFRHAEKVHGLLRDYADSFHQVNGMIRKIQQSGEGNQNTAPETQLKILKTLVSQREVMKKRMLKLMSPSEAWAVHYSQRLNAIMVWQKVEEGQEPGFLL